MKNKLFLVLIIITSICNISFSQFQEKYRITEFSDNGKDYSDEAVKNGVTFIFSQKTETSDFYFKNLWANKGSFSVGKIKVLETKMYEETEETIAAEMTLFEWNYSNSYDDNKGTAKVLFIRFIEDKIEKFKCEIYIESSDVLLKYSGYKI
jgi:hypothetical protein